MAPTTGIPPGGTTDTTGGKPRATKVIDSRDKPDAASAATTETSQPSADNILETSTGTTGTSSTNTSTLKDPLILHDSESFGDHT
ncbi:hypothetical protein [Skermanella pratensis]|uniref:hypothetical protein n=1 Tax=Skermanella pratensis TaxID=2233999 RepID=UPI00130161DF|nr:hypothetical protein [Skermanella pratensis]